MWKLLGGLVLCFSAVLAAAGGAADGGLTHTQFNRDAFSQPVSALSAAELRAFNFGNRLFNTNWIVAPASVEAFDGLGPTFNRVSCSGCHLRDGRGRPPVEGEHELLSMLLRLSIPGRSAAGGPAPVPQYGLQLNDRAISGVPVEGRVEIVYVEQPGQYADGQSYSLRRPEYRITGLGYGPLPDQLLMSPRVAPAVFGLGLLEAIAVDRLESLADPDDVDGNGISGRINRVHNPLSGRIEAGRFGWKANSASIDQQNLEAALGDIGLTSNAFAEQNCPAVQTDCRSAPSGGEPELPALFVERLRQYVQMLGIPAQRTPDALAVRAGARQFRAMGCADCHQPLQVTGPQADFAWLQNQRFAPYTDLLLHDMGPQLADQRPDFLATGSEWRTAPLWGLGLYRTTNGHQFLLHDGRARGAAEAILWHGGEAEAARERFRTAGAAERSALLAFLDSL